VQPLMTRTADLLRPLPMPMSGSLDEFLQDVQAALDDHPEYREGQAFFNVLRLRRPDLADQILTTNLDPCSVDARVADFLGWLEEHW